MQWQQKQVAYAVSLYYEMLQPDVNVETDSNVSLKMKTSEMTGKIPSPSQMQVHGESMSERAGARPAPTPSDIAQAEWDKTHADLSAEIKIRHYSPKTLETYILAEFINCDFSETAYSFVISNYCEKSYDSLIRSLSRILLRETKVE